MDIFENRAILKGWYLWVGCKGCVSTVGSVATPTSTDSPPPLAMPHEHFKLFVRVFHVHTLGRQVANLQLPIVLEKVSEAHVEFAVVFESQAQFLPSVLRDLSPKTVAGKFGFIMK